MTQNVRQLIRQKLKKFEEKELKIVLGALLKEKKKRSKKKR